VALDGLGGQVQAGEEVAHGVGDDVGGCPEVEEAENGRVSGR
jgi:hypothetical protein